MPACLFLPVPLQISETPLLPPSKQGGTPFLVVVDVGGQKSLMRWWVGEFPALSFPHDGSLSSFGWSSRAHSWEVTQHLFRVLQARCSKMKAILWCWEWRSIDLGWSQTGRHSHKVKEKWNAKGNKYDKGSIKVMFISTEKMSYIKSGPTTVILHCFDMWIWRVFI